MASSVLPKIKIGPSILNSNLANLAQESRRLLELGADYLHLDVMDGHFVPNLTFGHGTIKCLRKELGKGPFFDAHMMVSEPLRWIEAMADAGVSQYTYHYESTSLDKQREVIRKIKEAGMRVGLAIKPGTGVQEILPYVEGIDTVLIMTVEPGFGGQRFMATNLEKVEALRRKYKELDIEIDGGVGPGNVLDCCSAGANMIVSGTAITQAIDPKTAIDQIRKLAHDGFEKHSDN